MQTANLMEFVFFFFLLLLQQMSFVALKVLSVLRKKTLDWIISSIDLIISLLMTTHLFLLSFAKPNADWAAADGFLLTQVSHVYF